MSNMGMAMDQDVAAAFETLNGKVDTIVANQNTLCGARGERIARLEQHNTNGHVNKAESFNLWRVIISAIGLAIVTLQIMGMVK